MSTISTNDDAAIITGAVVDLNWFKLGNNFAALDDHSQYEFLQGILETVATYNISNVMSQMYAIIKQFDTLYPDAKPELAQLLKTFTEYLEAKE